MKNLVVAAVLALTLAACGAQDEPTVPVPVALDEAPIDGTCRGGYAIANRNGEWVCVPEGEQ